MVIRSFHVGGISIGAAECAFMTVTSKQRARSQSTGRHGMHTLSLSALLLAAAAASAIARPSGSTAAAMVSQMVSPQARALSPAHQYLNDFILPQLMIPRYLGYEESPQIHPARKSEDDWLNKEIDRINKIKEAEESANPYEMELLQWMPQDPDIPRLYEEPAGIRDMQSYLQQKMRTRSYNMHSVPPHKVEIPEANHRPQETIAQQQQKKETFALTPLDKGYFEPKEIVQIQQSDGPHEGGESKAVELEPPRQIRQNPNLNKVRTLVNEDLDRLKTRVANKDFRLLASLLPTNLRWLNLNHPKDVEESTPEDVENKKKSHSDVSQSQVDAVADPADSIYGVALIAAVGAAFAMVIAGFAFGWYTLSKKAKAAADVDYPAYGVTGPTVDTSGDRKLAHSAHMYHYQHQKQQIIAMERSSMEQGNGSVSDPESEEENEEGDYTVYECPGFATTGDMEVKNPLFSEEPTPAAPGKCDLVKPQPKE